MVGANSPCFSLAVGYIYEQSVWSGLHGFPYSIPGNNDLNSQFLWGAERAPGGLKWLEVL